MAKPAAKPGFPVYKIVPTETLIPYANNSRTHSQAQIAQLADLIREFGRVSGEERFGHATPKPVAMVERMMLSSLRRGELVIEPFAGTGSTVIGAEKTSRACYAMELSPAYVDVCVRRWQDYTGKQAINEATGQAFTVTP